MSDQHNKVIKRRRRDRYMKRKSQRVKESARPAAKPVPAPAPESVSPAK